MGLHGSIELQVYVVSDIARCGCLQICQTCDVDVDSSSTRWRCRSSVTRHWWTPSGCQATLRRLTTSHVLQVLWRPCHGSGTWTSQYLS